MRSTPPQKFGFSLVEALIVMGIFAALSAMVLVRYNRGNEDSALSRQVAVTIAAIRLAQEQSAGGTTVRYCTSDTGKVCTKAADCPSGTCNPAATPPGGMAVLFSCTSAAYSQQQLYFVPAAKTSYYTYADAVQCGTGEFCFGPVLGDGSQWTPNATDGLVSSYQSGGNLKGDPLVATNAFDSKVEVKDVQLTESETNVAFRCTSGARASGGSPWNGKLEPQHNDLVPADYPLQALIRFSAPDGRKTMVSDNVSTVTPADATYGTTGKAWGRIDVMLGLTSRTVDCRVIAMTREGVISQRVDGDCNLAT